VNDVVLPGTGPTSMLEATTFACPRCPCVPEIPLCARDTLVCPRYPCVPEMPLRAGETGRAPHRADRHCAVRGLTPLLRVCWSHPSRHFNCISLYLGRAPSGGSTGDKASRCDGVAAAAGSTLVSNPIGPAESQLRGNTMRQPFSINLRNGDRICATACCGAESRSLSRHGACLGPPVPVTNGPTRPPCGRTTSR
jgi:hypothetical protein